MSGHLRERELSARDTKTIARATDGKTAFVSTGLASRSSREEGGEPDRERRLVPEEGIEPTLPVKGTGF